MTSDHCITRSVRDSALFLSLTEERPGDFVKAPVTRPLRIATWTRGMTGLEPTAAVRRAHDEAIALLVDLGHVVEPLAAPDFDGPALAEAFLLASGAARRCEGSTSCSRRPPAPSPGGSAISPRSPRPAGSSSAPPPFSGIRQSKISPAPISRRRRALTPSCSVSRISSKRPVRGAIGGLPFSLNSVSARPLERGRGIARMNRRDFTFGAVSLVGGLTFARNASAKTDDDATRLVPDKDYEVLGEPFPTPDKRTIEVLHAFAFGLKPCYDFHRSTLIPWERDRAPDVKVSRVHPYWTDAWKKQQQALCTMQALRNESPLVMRAFNAYLVNRRDIFTDFVSFLTSLGFDRAHVAEVYDSDDVRIRMSATSKRMYEYKMPISSIIIDGRFRVDPSPQMMQTVEAIVQFVRAERAEQFKST